MFSLYASRVLLILCILFLAFSWSKSDSDTCVLRLCAIWIIDPPTLLDVARAVLGVRICIWGAFLAHVKYCQNLTEKGGNS